MWEHAYDEAFIAKTRIQIQRKISVREGRKYSRFMYRKLARLYTKMLLVQAYILLCFASLRIIDVCFLRLKIRLSTSKEIMIHFVAIFTLLWWSETGPTISLRSVCIYLQMMG